jgi:RNA polymerase sigma-70 factor (ECF subfamily)
MQQNNVEGVAITEGAADFDVLYRSAYPTILRCVDLIVLDSEVAREITHEAFLRLWQRRDAFPVDANHKAWLLRVATNLAISHHRSLLVRWRHRWELREPPDPASVALARIELEAMRHALQSLRRRERAALALRYDRGLTYHEIGAILRCPEATAKTVVRRALLKLRARLEPHTTPESNGLLEESR